MTDGQKQSDVDQLHLHVSVGNVTVEVEGPVDEAETWFEALKEDYLKDIDPETVPEATSQERVEGENTHEKAANGAGETSSQKSRSLAEYYKRVKNPSKMDSALLIGWYLEYQEDQEDFTRSEIEAKAKDAKIKLGANLGRDVRRQIEQGYLKKVDERDGSDTYYITIDGEEYITNELLNTQSEE